VRRFILGSALAARICGAKRWKDSLTIGALILMNTRLMELIVLNMGLELKVLTPEVLP
jgi:hypothetical protein